MNFSISLPTETYSAQFPTVAFYGRTLAEYAAFFDLDPARDLAGRRILDCGAGVASFTAEACRLGAAAIAVDPYYGRTPTALTALGASEIARVLCAARSHQGNFQFSFYSDFDHVERCRRAALDGFVRDYAGGFASGRYVRAALPALPFADGAFDLALNSHCLFLYAERFGEEFLAASLRELLRVAREVRLYPLFSLDGRNFAEEPAFLQKLAGPDARLEIQPVSFRFFKEAGDLLRLRHDG